MADSRFSVIQVGFGPMGRLVAKLLFKRQNINLLSIIDIDPSLKNRNVRDILEDETLPDLEIKSDVEEVIKGNSIDVMIIATSSSIEKIHPLVKLAVNSGINVISLCEQLSYPFLKYPKISGEIDSLAKEKKGTVLGTGINPGYLMDLLPIVITAPTQKVDHITVTRMMNSAKRRGPFQKKISKKEITGHVGLEESIGMILSALGLDYDEIKEFSPEPVIADKEIVTPYTKVEPGEVCGLKSIAIASTPSHHF
ncbi:MAG: hypothetical protein ACTSR2_06595 [Candidatus Hodarchaeales archaeon]